MNSGEVYESWLANPNLDEDLRKELVAIKDDKKEIEELIAETKKAIESGNTDDMKSSKDKLQEKLISVSSAIYEEAAKAAQAANAESGTETNSSDNVKEADYEEK